MAQTHNGQVMKNFAQYLARKPMSANKGNLVMKHRLKGRLALEHFLFLMPFIGFCLAGINDYYHNVVADYSSTPMLTTLGEELADFIYPTGIFAFIFLVLFRHFANILFRTEFDGNKISDIKKGTEADKAFFHGGCLIFLGALLYMIFYTQFGSLFT